MFRSSLAIAALLAFPACTSNSSAEQSGGKGGAGGKADDIRTCAEGRTCLQFRSYEVLFTNPVCSTYNYDAPVSEVDGEREILAKPKNVYCNGEFDSDASRLRDSSPQSRLLEWVNALDAGDEIFLAYLSFSDATVAAALCEAEGRGADVTFVLDKLSARAEDLQACGGEVLIRGHVGSVGFAHNKVVLVNADGAGPSDDNDGFMKMSYGSGNMSSGTHLHHENWHFIDVARDSFFAQSHLCLMEALIPEERTAGKGAFSDFMAECRSGIDAEPEDDITAYFIPALADRKALLGGNIPSNSNGDWFRQTDLLTLIDQSAAIDIGAHRFSARVMIDALEARLLDNDRPFHLRFVADDDLYWLKPLPPSEVQVVGFNTFGETVKLDQLRDADGDNGRFEEAYMETNHAAHLLHHNKFLIFQGRDSAPDAVLMGSPNLTGTGFDSNLENLYITDIPEVVQAFKAQYALWWDGEGPLPEGHDVAPRATHADDMPIEVFAPSTPSDGGSTDPNPEPAECGLRIVEVLYDAVSADDGKEWVKLYNSCEDDVALDGVSLGWGGSRYTGGLDLEGTLDGKRCMIIGGPSTDATNGGPTIDLVANFSPDLQNSGSTADGIALFASAAADIDGEAIPLDAVIYGQSNTSGLLDASGAAPEPHVGDAKSGDSIVRVSAREWEIADEPTPDACPTF
ncbi:MAG: hypothetical protein JKY37_11355 [Nannocystaceae bacterium]|nr:hypothetical protein [Nannocystaceae bacterium]